MSELQYHFGVPREHYDTRLPEAPARFSLGYDYNHFVPVTIAGKPFTSTLQSISNNEVDIARLTKVAQEYVIKLDPEMRNSDDQYSPISNIEIGRYGIIDNGYDFAYSDRGDRIDTYDELDDILNFRTQSGDQYRASIHNSGIPYEHIFAMLAVGMINRVALENDLPGLIC